MGWEFYCCLRWELYYTKRWELQLCDMGDVLLCQMRVYWLPEVGVVRWCKQFVRWE